MNNSAKYEDCVMGRKFCTACKHWRHAIDFPVRRWADDDKTAPYSLQSRCYSCIRVLQRPKRRVENMGGKQHRSIKAYNRAAQRRIRRLSGVPERPGGAYVKGQKKPDSVPIQPFREWLAEKVQVGVTIELIAIRTGLSERTIYSYLKGYDRSGKNRLTGKSGKIRVIDWIELETVDVALTKYGEPHRFSELYPVTSTD